MEKNMATLFHSGHLLMLAQQSYERSLIKPWEALSSIVLSTLTFECFVNELEERLKGEQAGLLQRLYRTLVILEDERASLLSKIDSMHLALLDRRVDRGAVSFQNLQFLYRLRNALVHRRPERFEYDFENSEKEYEPHRFVRYLVGRHVIAAPSVNSPAQWSSYVIVPEVAKWAHNSLIKWSEDIVSWLPEGAFRKVNEFHIREWKVLEP